MTSMWRKAMHYLGLGPDDEYEDDLGFVDDGGDPDGSGYGRGTAAPAGRPARPATRPMVPPPPPATTGTVSRLEPSCEPAVASTSSAAEVAGVRSLSSPPRPAGSLSSGAVRTIAAVARVAEVAPHGFNEAQQVGDRFKAGSAVAMDLSGVDRDLARRLIDFCSGLCYALGGKMERLGGQTYLIIPSGVEVSAEDRRRLTGTEA